MGAEKFDRMNREIILAAEGGARRRRARKRTARRRSLLPRIALLPLLTKAPQSSLPNRLTKGS